MPYDAFFKSLGFKGLNDIVAVSISNDGNE